VKAYARDNRSHAPAEVRNKCLDLSRVYIAGTQEGRRKKEEGRRKKEGRRRKEEGKKSSE
jgi:hypothetical protein